MSETPEEKEALAKLDQATRDVAWQEEDKELALERRYGLARWFRGWLPRFDLLRRRPLEKGLRDTLRGDDKN